MATSSNADRFTGLADIYAAHRPTYPASMITALGERARRAAVPSIAFDVGCGTGISTRALRSAVPDWRVIAADPNADMLAKAEQTCADLTDITFIEGGAEALPGERGGVGLVLAAQAFHWFDHPAFFAEAARVLAPGGLLAILYNNRQNAVSVVLQEIESYLEGIDETYSRNYRSRDIPAMLRALENFGEVERVRDVWLKPTSVDDLVNYFMSRSMLQPLAARVGIPKLRQRIGDIADQHARAGMLDIPFATELDLAVRM